MFAFIFFTFAFYLPYLPSSGLCIILTFCRIFSLVFTYTLISPIRLPLPLFVLPTSFPMWRLTLRPLFPSQKTTNIIFLPSNLMIHLMHGQKSHQKSPQGLLRVRFSSASDNGGSAFCQNRDAVYNDSDDVSHLLKWWCKVIFHIKRSWIKILVMAIVLKRGLIKAMWFILLRSVLVGKKKVYRDSEWQWNHKGLQ